MGFPLQWGGQSLLLLADPALWWPAGRTLFVADLHLGKEHVLQAAGLPVPAGTTDDDLDRLGDRVRELACRRLAVLGDLWHGRASRTEPVLGGLRRWRRTTGDLEVVLVRGNHDRWVGDPPDELGIRVVEGPWRLGPFVLRHEPTTEADVEGEAFELAGHVHPVVRLRGPGGDRLRVPCFRFGLRRCVLPSYGGLTGGGEIRPRPGDRIFAVGEDEVVEVRTGPGG